MSTQRYPVMEVSPVRDMLVKLRERKVFRVLATYAVGSWLLVQVADVILAAFDAPPWILRSIILLLAVGLPVAAALAVGGRD